MNSSLGLPRPADARGSGRRRWSALAGAGVFTALSLGLPMSAAVAAAATTTIGISAVVQATCVISAAPLVFGTYTGVVLNGTAALSVTCTNTTPYTVSLTAGAGTGPVATITARHMMAGAAVLNYMLTQDAAHATNWGDTPALSPASANGTGAAVPITVYGQVAAGQYVAPGTYNDTVTATVNF